MCQLTYINIPNINSLRLATILCSMVNTELDHKNGFGFCQDDRIYKTDETPKNSNFPEINKIIVNKNPVILHVRKASFSVANLLGAEYNHPFRKENIILAHNGTLEHLSEKLPENTIDTQFFFQKMLEKEGTAIEKLTETMKEFTGKFAFLMRSNEGDYIIRGKTAGLHKIDVFRNDTKIGFIVNTEPQSLKNSKVIISKLLIPFIPNISFGDMEALEIETIYKVDGTELIKTGKIEENSKKVVEVKASGNISVSKEKQKLPYNETNTEYIDRILFEFSNKTEMTVAQIDVMFRSIYGNSIIYAKNMEILEFIELLDDLLDSHIFKSRIKAWKYRYNISVWDIYEQSNFRFPFFFNTPSEIKGAIAKTKKVL